MQLSRTAWFLLAAVALLALGAGGDGPRQTLAVDRGAAPGALQVYPTPVNENVQLIYVVDPVKRALAVYRMEVKSGKLKLEAVRQCKWDLMLTHLNNEKPHPDDIRRMVEAQK